MAPGNMRNFSAPQPCAEHVLSEGLSPSGSGSAGHCPFGVRSTRPAGTFCPRDGLLPNRLRARLLQRRSARSVPASSAAPSARVWRIQPAICPPATLVVGAVGRANMRCPRRYCPSGSHGRPQSKRRSDPTLYPGYLLSRGRRRQTREEGRLRACPPCFPAHCESASVDPGPRVSAGFYCPEGRVTYSYSRGFYAERKGP